MESVKEKIVDKLEFLPEQALQEVLTFVDFIAWRSRHQAEDISDPLLSVAGILSGEAISAEEIRQLHILLRTQVTIKLDLQFLASDAPY